MSEELQEPVAEPVPTAAPAEETQVVDLDEALHPLRVQIVGLGVAFFVVSLSFSAFVYKQNRSLQLGIQERSARVAQMQQSEQQMLPVLNELAGYSVNKPELMGIFQRHGLQIGPNQNAPAPAK